MAQNVCLEKSSQSMFAKAVKNIKTLMKKNEEAKNDKREKSNIPTVKTVLGRTRKTRRRNNRFLGRGVVYLRHIPKGFYEDEMKEYFSQFGRVTRLNVVRSKATGNPKGYAFIEFLYSEVAQVVAETMNNYLLFGKILKAEYIPGDRVGPVMFPFNKIRPENCPRSHARDLWIEKTNRLHTDEEISEMAAHELKKLDKIKKKMEENGITFDCQVDGDVSLLDKIGVVDIPELDEIKPKVENGVNSKLLKQKNRKRSLSGKFNSDMPVKKRMTLIQGLKSKKMASMQSPPESLDIDKTPPFLRLKKMDQSSIFKQAQKKSPSIFVDKENSSPKQTPKESFTTTLSPASNKTPRGKKLKKSPVTSMKKQKSPGQKADMELLGSTKKSPNTNVTKKLHFSASKQKSPSKITTRQLVGSAKKEKTLDGTTEMELLSAKKQKPRDSSTEKKLFGSKKELRSPRTENKLLGKRKSHDASTEKSPGTKTVVKSPDSLKKSKSPVSTKKGKKSPLLVGKRAFSTSKKSPSSRLTKKVKPIKVKTP